MTFTIRDGVCTCDKCHQVITNGALGWRYRQAHEIDHARKEAAARIRANRKETP